VKGKNLIVLRADSMKGKNLVMLRMTLLNAHGRLYVDSHGEAGKVIGEENGNSGRVKLSCIVFDK